MINQLRCSAREKWFFRHFWLKQSNVPLALTFSIAGVQLLWSLMCSHDKALFQLPKDTHKCSSLAPAHLEIILILYIVTVTRPVSISCGMNSAPWAASTAATLWDKADDCCSGSGAGSQVLPAAGVPQPQRRQAAHQLYLQKTLQNLLLSNCLPTIPRMTFILWYPSGINHRKNTHWSIWMPRKVNWSPKVLYKRPKHCCRASPGF